MDIFKINIFRKLMIWHLWQSPLCLLIPSQKIALKKKERKKKKAKIKK
jgi:hypothetical protein